MAYFPSSLTIASPFRTDVGTGSAGPYTVTHGLGTRDLCVIVRRNAGQADNIGLANPGEIIDVQVVPTGLNTCSIIPDETWSLNQMHVSIYPFAGEDVTAPGTPVITQGTITQTTAVLNVTGSDNVGVTFWEWDNNGTFLARTPVGTPTYTVTGLLAATTYANLGCTAVDLQGNRTRASTSVTTLATQVALDAVGTYNAVAGAGYTGSVTSQLVVGSGNNRMALAIVELSNVNPIPLTTWTIGVTSSLGGTWTLIDKVSISTGTNGSVWLFACTAPATGTHTLTANINANGSQYYDWGRMGSICYTGVASIVERVTRTAVVTVAALSAAVTSAVGNMAVLAFGSANGATTLTAGTSRIANGANNNGDGDYMLVADLPGAATATFTGSATVHSYITADLVHA